MATPAVLIVLEGANRGAVFQLLPDVNRLGRESGCEVAVLDDAASRHHADVAWSVEEGFVLQDRGSRNGTQLNGLPCRAPTRLQPGDTIGIGQTRLLFAHADPDQGVSWAGQSTMVVPSAEVGAGEALTPVALELPPELVGDSQAFRDVLEQALRCAALDATVLLVGESGTGKELVARAIHRASPRRGGPLVEVNAALLGGALAESELFGHERGAFTGALARRAGCLERADGGTLFLDEVGELPLEAQAKLLRAVETRRFQRVGGAGEVQSDFRLIAATHRDLRAMVAEGTFREDLLYRLDVARLTLPPLRQREGDVALLAQHFLAALGGHMNTPVRGFTPAALAALEAHPFPGNVRELRNVIERALIFARGAELTVADLPAELTRGAGAAAEPESAERPIVPLAELEKREVARAMEATGGNKTQAAQLLGIDRKTLYAKLERHGLGGA
jgi:DNA-binding NtrC family response regulator